MVILALRRVGKGQSAMRQQGTKTRYPGVYRVNDNSYRLRAIAVDPRTGKKKAVEKLVVGVSAQEAARMRSALMQEIRVPAPETRRIRIGEFARSWMKSKTISIDPATARTYADALDQHVLPAFGDFWFDALTKSDVQQWVNASLTSTYETKGGKQKRYTRNAIHAWFRVLRAMVRDAVEALGLPRDPTVRIAFPDPVPREEANTLDPTQLVKFLAAFRARYPQHHGLVTLLAFTGLRFCHASALRWEDWDEGASVLLVRRKQVRGKVGPISRKKRAPAVIPVEGALADVLVEHRQRLQRTPKLFEKGWMFPSEAGTLRAPSTLDKAWSACVEVAGITHRFTPHGLRYAFTDLVRLAKVDAVVRRALTGHVTEEMQRKYSTVGLDEKRSALGGALAVLRSHQGSGPATVHAGEGVNAGVNEGRNEQRPAERAQPAGGDASSSGIWDSNPRRSAWEADTLPLS
jgi:integrase